MSVPSASELALLKTLPHQTKLWLSIYQPSVAMAARVIDNSIARGARTITYYAVSQGSYQLVEPDMVMLVGTTAGGDEKGRVRVRSIIDGFITVAENSHIEWADGDYLTILRFVEITAVFPRIIQDPNDEENVIFYKDYDIAYTNQNSILGTFICMGPHHAGFLESGSTNVYYTASGTSNMLGDTLSYSWFFEGGTPSGSASHTPGNVAYDTPGHYTTRLIVSGSSGSVESSYRYVSIYNRPNEGTNNPILLWEMDALSGSRDAGGYNAMIRIRQNVPKNVLRDGALVVIFADDWYGITQQSVGGNNLGRTKVVFVGYIAAGTIRHDYANSNVEFEILSPTGIMQDIEGFVVSVESVPSATTWFELDSMNVKRALYHFLRWHSTVLKCTDVEFRGTDQNIQYFDSDRESIYDAVYNVMRNALYGNIVCDRQGKMWAEVEVAATHLASGSFPTSMEWDKSNWMNEPTIDERQRPELSWMEMGGVYFDGSEWTPHLACAPGSVPGYLGGVERIQALALSGQSQLNTLVGDVYASRNSRYPAIEYEAVGNYRNLDIAPQEFISVTMNAADTVRGVTFAKKSFSVQFMQWTYRADKLLLLPVLTVSEVTSGVAGETIPIPEESPSEGYSQPPFPWPRLPIPASPAPVLIMSSGTAIELYDEGDYLGDITQIDFYGDPVAATINNHDGTVTFACSGTAGYDDSIGLSMQGTTPPSGTASQPMLCGGPIHYNGISLIPASIYHYGAEIIIAGTYMVMAFGKAVYSGLDLPGEGGRIIANVHVMQYTSLGALVATYTGAGTPAYKVTTDEGTVIIDETSFGYSVVIEADVGDRILVYWEMTGAGADKNGTTGSGYTISMVRL